MEAEPVMTVGFWESAWDAATSKSNVPELILNIKSLWDTRVRGFQEERSVERVAAVRDLLDQANMLDKGKTFLDVGCGTGSFVLALKDRFRKTTAFDCSGAALSILREKAHDCHNIEIIQGDINNCELTETYDVVLGSLNPALYNQRAFKTILGLCQDTLIYVGRSTPLPEPKGEDELGVLLLGKQLHSAGSNHVLYPIGLLMALGYQPQLAHVSYTHVRKERREEAIGRLNSQYRNYAVKAKDPEKVITAFVDERLEDGWYVDRAPRTFGIVLCKLTHGE